MKTKLSDEESRAALDRVGDALAYLRRIQEREKLMAARPRFNASYYAATFSFCTPEERSRLFTVLTEAWQWAHPQPETPEWQK